MWNDENRPFNQRNQAPRVSTNGKLQQQNFLNPNPCQDLGLITESGRKIDRYGKTKLQKNFGRKKDYRYSKDHQSLGSYKVNKESDSVGNGNQTSPFIIELGKLDCELSYRTNNNIINTRRALQFDSEIDQHLSQIYSFSNQILLVHANQILNEVQDSKKRATEEWLRSKTEEERMQYLSRNKPTATGYI